MNLVEAELQKRSSELDAREKYLDAKLEILQNGPLNLEVYEAQVKAKEGQLARLSRDINEASENQESLLQQHRLTEAKLDEQIASKQRKLDNLLNDIKKAEETLKIAQRATDEEKAKLDETRDYLKQQEIIIEDAISTGNERLLDIKDEVGLRESELNDYTGRIVVVKGEYDDLVVMTDEAKYQYTKLTDDLTTQKNELDHQLKETIGRVAKEGARYKKVKAEVDSKLAVLKEKEESMLAQRDAMRLERQQLHEDRRRLNSTQSLYDN